MLSKCVLLATVATTVLSAGTSSANTNVPGPTGVQGPTGTVGLTHIRGQTGSMTGITGLTGATGNTNLPTGPGLSIFPTMTGATGSATGVADSPAATGATGVATLAQDPNAALELLNQYQKRTEQYKLDVLALQPQGPYGKQPSYVNQTIDDVVSEQRRRSRYVSYYILPKLNAMKIPIKTELNCTSVVLNECRVDLAHLEQAQLGRENNLLAAQRNLTQAVSSLTASRKNVAAGIKALSSSSIYSFASPTSASTSNSVLLEENHPAKQRSTTVPQNHRLVQQYSAAAKLHQHVQQLQQLQQLQKSTATAANLIELMEQHPLLYSSNAVAAVAGAPSPLDAQPMTSLLEQTSTSLQQMLDHTPTDQCSLTTACARRADLRAVKSSNEVNVHVYNYLLRISQERVAYRTQQCNRYEAHRDDILRRRQELEHIIHVWNATTTDVPVGKVALSSLVPLMGVPPSPDDIPMTGMPHIPVVFPPIPYLPKENKCLRICSHQGRCAWAKETPDTSQIFDGKTIHSTKDVAFPKEDNVTMVAVCICHDEYEGEDCGVKKCPNKCSHHGHCLDGECMCHDGWYGTSCGLEENENSTHIKRRRSVEETLNNGMKYLGDRANSSDDGSAVDGAIGTDSYRALGMHRNAASSNTSFDQSLKSKERANKIMMMAEYMRLEGSKNSKLEEQMQKLQDRGVVDKDTLMMQRVQARQVEEAKKEKVRAILKQQEESKKKIVRDAWLADENDVEKREKKVEKIEQSNIRRLEKARVLDERSTLKSIVLGDHIVGLVSNMVIRNKCYSFDFHTVPREKIPSTPQETIDAYQHLEGVHHGFAKDKHAVELEQHLRLALAKRQSLMKPQYDAADQEERQRSERSKLDTSHVEYTLPKLPRNSSNVWDDYFPRLGRPMVQDPRGVYTRAKSIVDTMASRELNMTNDLNHADKYTRLATYFLTHASSMQEQHSPSMELQRLMNHGRILPTLQSLEATTTKKEHEMTPLLPYRHRAKVTTNYSSDYADASEIIRRMENQRDVHNSQHEESVKTLEKSLRNTMRMVNHSEAVHESYYRALHDQKKRHLQRQEEFRKRLYREQSDLYKKKLKWLFGMVGDSAAPTAQGICTLREKNPYQHADPVPGIVEGNWMLMPKGALSGEHSCTNAKDGNSSACMSAKYTMNEKQKRVPDYFIEVKYDAPTVMYLLEDETNGLEAASASGGGNLRSSRKKKSVLQSVPMASVVNSSRHASDCLDARLERFDASGNAKPEVGAHFCYWEYETELLPQHYLQALKHDGNANQSHAVNPIMSYGVYQSTTMQELPPINTITVNDYEFCITKITNPEANDVCMKCPAIRRLDVGVINFALYGQLLSNASTFMPDKKMAYFRHRLVFNIEKGYHTLVFFNEDRLNTLEYAQHTKLDIKTITFVEAAYHSATPPYDKHGNMTMSFERDFNINNRELGSVSQITVEFDPSHPMQFVILIDLPMDRMQPGDRFLYDPEISSGSTAPILNEMQPEPTVAGCPDSTNPECDHWIPECENSTKTYPNCNSTDPDPPTPPTPDQNCIATLSRNAAQHCSRLTMDEWCASLGSIQTCCLSVQTCHGLGITKIKDVNDLHWKLPDHVITPSIYVPSNGSDGKNSLRRGGVSQGTADCDKDCVLSAKARAFMKKTLHNIFNVSEPNATTTVALTGKDVDVRQQQDRKSVVLIRSLAHLLATGQQPTIGVEVSEFVVF